MARKRARTPDPDWRPPGWFRQPMSLNHAGQFHRKVLQPASRMSWNAPGHHLFTLIPKFHPDNPTFALWTMGEGQPDHAPTWEDVNRLMVDAYQHPAERGYRSNDLNDHLMRRLDPHELISTGRWGVVPGYGAPDYDWQSKLVLADWIQENMPDVPSLDRGRYTMHPDELRWEAEHIRNHPDQYPVPPPPPPPPPDPDTIDPNDPAVQAEARRLRGYAATGTPTYYADPHTLAELIRQLHLPEQNEHRLGRDNNPLGGLRGILADAMEEHDPEAANHLRTPGRHVMEHQGRIVPGRFSHLPALDRYHELMNLFQMINAGDYPVPEFDMLEPGDEALANDAMGEHWTRPVAPGTVRIINHNMHAPELGPTAVDLPHHGVPQYLRQIAADHMQNVDPFEWAADREEAMNEAHAQLERIRSAPIEAPDYPDAGEVPIGDLTPHLGFDPGDGGNPPAGQMPVDLYARTNYGLAEDIANLHAQLRQEPQNWQLHGVMADMLQDEYGENHPDVRFRRQLQDFTQRSLSGYLPPVTNEFGFLQPALGRDLPEHILLRAPGVQRSQVWTPALVQNPDDGGYLGVTENASPEWPPGAHVRAEMEPGWVWDRNYSAPAEAASGLYDEWREDRFQGRTPGVPAHRHPHQMAPAELLGHRITPLADLDPNDPEQADTYPQLEAFLRDRFDRGQKFAAAETFTPYGLAEDIAAFHRTLRQNPTEVTGHRVFADFLGDAGLPEDEAFRRQLADWLEARRTHQRPMPNYDGTLWQPGRAGDDRYTLPTWRTFGGNEFEVDTRVPAGMTWSSTANGDTYPDDETFAWMQDWRAPQRTVTNAPGQTNLLEALHLPVDADPALVSMRRDHYFPRELFPAERLLTGIDDIHDVDWDNPNQRTNWSIIEQDLRNRFDRGVRLEGDAEPAMYAGPHEPFHPKKNPGGFASIQPGGMWALGDNSYNWGTTWPPQWAQTAGNSAPDEAHEIARSLLREGHVPHGGSYWQQGFDSMFGSSSHPHDRIYDQAPPDPERLSADTVPTGYAGEFCGRSPTDPWVTPEESMWHDYGPVHRYATESLPTYYGQADDLRALWDNVRRDPSDHIARKVMADWLQENTPFAVHSATLDHMRNFTDPAWVTPGNDRRWYTGPITTPEVMFAELPQWMRAGVASDTPEALPPWEPDTFRQGPGGPFVGRIRTMHTPDLDPGLWPTIGNLWGKKLQPDGSSGGLMTWDAVTSDLDHFQREEQLAQRRQQLADMATRHASQVSKFHPLAGVPTSDRYQRADYADSGEYSLFNPYLQVDPRLGPDGRPLPTMYPPLPQDHYTQAGYAAYADHGYPERQTPVYPPVYPGPTDRFGGAPTVTGRGQFSVGPTTARVTGTPRPSSSVSQDPRRPFGFYARSGEASQPQQTTITASRPNPSQPVQSGDDSRPLGYAQTQYAPRRYPLPGRRPLLQQPLLTPGRAAVLPPGPNRAPDEIQQRLRAEIEARRARHGPPGIARMSRATAYADPYWHAGSDYPVPGGNLPPEGFIARRDTQLPPDYDHAAERMSPPPVRTQVVGGRPARDDAARALVAFSSWLAEEPGPVTSGVFADFLDEIGRHEEAQAQRMLFSESYDPTPAPPADWSPSPIGPGIYVPPGGFPDINDPNMGIAPDLMRGNMEDWLDRMDGQYAGSSHPSLYGDPPYPGEEAIYDPDNKLPHDMNRWRLRVENDYPLYVRWRDEEAPDREVEAHPSDRWLFNNLDWINRRMRGDYTEYDADDYTGEYGPTEGLNETARRWERFPDLEGGPTSYDCGEGEFDTYERMLRLQQLMSHLPVISDRSDYAEDERPSYPHGPQHRAFGYRPQSWHPITGYPARKHNQPKFDQSSHESDTGHETHHPDPKPPGATEYDLGDDGDYDGYGETPDRDYWRTKTPYDRGSL